MRKDEFSSEKLTMYIFLIFSSVYLRRALRWRNAYLWIFLFSENFLAFVDTSTQNQRHLSIPLDNNKSSTEKIRHGDKLNNSLATFFSLAHSLELLHRNFDQ